MIFRKLNINGWWALFYKNELEPKGIFPTERDCQDYLELQSWYNTEDFRTEEIRHRKNGIAEFTGYSTSIPKMYLLRRTILEQEIGINENPN